MEHSRGEARLNPKPIMVGEDWQIIAYFPSGEIERICGFVSEAEALLWIQDASGAWLKKRVAPTRL
jgi:hypothetical protein